MSTLHRMIAGAAGLTAAVILRRWISQEAFPLRGKRVLITGASRGLGFVLARQALAKGAAVAICGRDRETVDRAQQLLEADGLAFARQCDITDQERVADFVDAVTDRFGGIDVLINNAGVISVGPIETMTLADFESAMKTHFWGHVFTTLAVLPQMKRRRAGRIVNISSIGGVIGIPHLVPYCASKFALTGFSEALCSELAEDNIRVTTVIPGLMRTGSPPHADFKGQHEAEHAWFTISDSLPGASIGVERAARQIWSACRRGDPNLVISLPAKLAAAAHGVMPGTTACVLAAVHRTLPGPGDGDTRAQKGRDSTSAWAPSILTTLTEEAAERTNQLP